MKFSLIFTAVLLTGCAQTSYWLKDGGSQDEFNRTQASCHNDAYFLPKSSTPQSQPSYRVTAQVDPFGVVRASATPYKSPYQSLGDGLSSFADAMDNIAMREKFIGNCMTANGWKQIAASDVSLTIDTLARVGLNPQIEYTGKATGYLDGSGTIKLQSANNNQCVGTFKYDATFTGGTGVVRCDDGDSAQIIFTKLTNSSGFGGGTSLMGKPVRFVYGVPPELRERYLQDGLPDSLRGVVQQTGR